MQRFRVSHYNNYSLTTHFVLALDKQVKELLCVDYSLSEVSHQTNQSSVPFVDDLGECGGPRGHQDLTNTVVEATHRLLVDTKEALSCTLLCHLQGEGKGSSYVHVTLTDLHVQLCIDIHVHVHVQASLSGESHQLVNVHVHTCILLICIHVCTCKQKKKNQTLLHLKLGGVFLWFSIYMYMHVHA